MEMRHKDDARRWSSAAGIAAGGAPFRMEWGRDGSDLGTSLW
jgi:hypothetical protein